MEDKDKEDYYVHGRSRSVAIVVRGGKILMERVFYFGREFYTVPGGGIEPGETPEQAVLRELKEETGLEGKIVKPLVTIHKDHGSSEYSFEVEVTEDQEAITGYDPEESTENPPLREVLWMSLEEIRTCGVNKTYSKQIWSVIPRPSAMRSNCSMVTFLRPQLMAFR